jgi:hypothetical protein
LAGCYGGRGGDADGEEEGTADGGGSDDGAVDAFCEEASLPGHLSRFVRLTHRQYDNTVADLLGVTDDPAQTFIGDPALSGFTNNAEQLRVNEPLARDYRRAAEQIAADLVQDPTRLSSLVPCDPAAAGCASEFVATFGRRAFRRPLEAAQQAQLEAIFFAGAGLYEAGGDFDQGVAMVVEAVLQSPSFLYRSELSAPSGDGNLVALDGYEIATRLSYMFWNSMPDEALLAAAEAGELDSAEGVAAQAERLLADPRAADPIDDFHQQWLGMSKYAALTKDPDLYPEFVEGITDSMQDETLAFARRVILEGDGTFAALMTSSESYIDGDLAAIYGVAGPGADPQWVQLDPATRAGLLTQPGFLASHAYFAGSSPIHRGVFVQRQVMCTQIPDPPGDANLELPPAGGELVTTRDRVAYHTSADACQGCHQLINEPGYAFEGYDAIGRVRDQDNGAPVDAAGTLLSPEGDVTFTDGVDLVQQLAVHPQAQRCYMTQWFRYASSRTETADDACTLDGLHETLAEGGYDVRELLVNLTQTVSFRYRNAEGEQ